MAHASGADWERLIGTATPLTERLERGFVASRARRDAGAGASALGRWRAVLGVEGPRLLERRLRWCGWRIEHVRACLGPGRLPRRLEAPAWAETLHAITAAASAAQPADRPAGIDADRPLPFEDVHIGHLVVAARRLRARLHGAGVPRRFLTAAAEHDLLRLLAARLSLLAAPTLAACFGRTRGPAVDALAVLLADASGNRDDLLYRRFVGDLLADGLVRFYCDYPVLARLGAEAVDRWVANAAAMLERLWHDLPVLSAELGWQAPQDGADTDRASAAVVAVTGGLSDPHEGGATVHVLRLANGAAVVYKPKNVWAEVAFGELLRWLTQAGAPLPLMAHRAVDRGEYGWSELVAARPCTDDEQAARFYQRAGMLLCLFHALGTSDCHFENFVADGEHPRLIDLDTLLPVELNRWGRKPERGDGWYAAADELYGGVMATGMLPRWIPGGPGGKALDIGGLGGGVGGDQLVPSWRNVNRDAMGRVWLRTTVPPHPNVPRLDGEALDAWRFEDETLDGFTRMYRFLLDRREAVAATEGPIRGLGGVAARIVFRPTRAYAALLERCLRPDHLGDGAAFSIELEVLVPAFLQSTQRPASWPLLVAEIAALEHAEIPSFRVAADSCSLELGGRRVTGVVARPSTVVVADRLRKLSAADLELQRTWIRSSFACCRPPLTAAANGGRGLSGSHHGQFGRDPADAADRVAARLIERAVVGADGSVCWTGVETVGDDDYFRLAPLGPHLYDGTVGVAIFLAAHHRIAGNPRAAALARAALAPLVALARGRCTGSRAAEHGIGGFRGKGSWIYGLTRVGELLDDETLIAGARDLALSVDPSSIRADRVLDLVGGSAGATLALLALAGSARLDEADTAAVRKRAVECGRHLLACRSAGAQGLRAWRSRTLQPLTGLSHGAAGICLALGRLWEGTGEDSFLEAAIEGIDYERLHFDEGRGNWRDLRGRGGACAETWCHGGPGIALSRLGLARSLGAEAVRADLEAGLRIAALPRLPPVDHLCCGAMGRVDILVSAYEALGDEAMRTAARRIAGAALERAGSLDGFRLVGATGAGLFVPSMMRGIAGIGYALLRLQAPAALPSILALE